MSETQNKVETKFTKGPWRSAGFAVYAPDGTQIFHTGFGLLPPRRSEEAEANASLISASPELYEACAACLEDYEAEHVGGRRLRRETIIEMLRAALSKGQP